jgi:CheY-like chemotaxis protein
MKKSILIVDDYFAFQRLLNDVLLEEGYMPQMVSSGKDCLELLFSDSRPDLILLDWQMPGLSGFEVLKKVKSDLVTQQIPVIMVTGEQDVEDMALEAGAFAVIIKPVDFKKLLMVIQTALQELNETVI